MTASVAMCTYNGARYIREQLLSILHQSVPVDEIIICDDGSMDETITIIEKLRLDIERFGVRLLVEENRKSLGVNANFEKAMGLCSGDIIFLSDQDDLWEANKVEMTIQYMKEHPNKQVVFGNAWLIDMAGMKLTERTLLDIAGFSKENQWFFDHGYAWEMWCQESRATGATMAVRNSFVQGMSMTQGNIRYHDAVLAIEALKEDALGYIVEPLTRYRRHNGQESGDWDYNATYNANLFEATLPHFDFRARGVDRRVQDRIEFMKERYGMKWKWWGFASFCSIGKYRELYGVLWRQFFKHDVKVSVEHSIRRFKKKFDKMLHIW